VQPSAGLPINPPAEKLGSENAIVRGVQNRYFVPEFEGCLSVKTVARGSALWRAGNRSFQVDEDRYLILNDRQSYTLSIDSTWKVETFCLFFERGYVEDVFRSSTMPEAALLDTPESRPEGGPMFVERLETAASPVHRAIARLRAEVAAGIGRIELEAGFRRAAEAMVWDHETARSAIAKVPALRASTRQELYRRLLRGRDFLLGSLTSAVRLKDAASEACMSPYHFHRAFTRAFGETPHAYVTRLRLERAAALLKRGDVSVTEICLDGGFESPTSFSALFRKRFGVSPREFRRIAAY
jgi:AraC family transcriptional regulator